MIASHLQERFNDLCQICDASVLLRSFGLHDMQDIREPGLFTVCLDSGPFGFGCCDNVRVGVAEIIRLYHSVVVNLYAVKDPVPLFLALPSVEKQ